MSPAIDVEIERRKKLIDEAYKQALNYTNIIILAGYVGIFSIWSFTEKFLSKNPSFIVALMLGTSLFIFCAWEIYKMVYSSKFLNKQVSILHSKEMSEEKIKLLDEVNAEIIKCHASFIKCWILILCTSIPLGFGGALLLFYYFINGLIV